MARKRSLKTLGALIGVTAASSVYLVKTRSESVWENISMPLIRMLDAETAHRMSIKLASKGLIPRFPTRDEDKEVLVSLYALFCFKLFLFSNFHRSDIYLSFGLPRCRAIPYVLYPCSLVWNI